VDETARVLKHHVVVVGCFNQPWCPVYVLVGKCDFTIIGFTVAIAIDEPVRELRSIEN